MSHGLVIFDILVTGYFPHLGRLSQLLGLSQQLDNDLNYLGRHKYIGHQLAVVHVSFFFVCFFAITILIVLSQYTLT